MEKVKLSQWAKDNNKPYKEVWKMVQNGSFPEKIERTSTNRLLVLKEDAPKPVTAKSKVTLASPMATELVDSPLGKTKQSRAARRNKAATSKRTDPYYYIENGIDPYLGGNSRGATGNDSVSVKDAIVLTQKAYYNFSDFKNIIDVMTEFSTNKIYFRGGTEKSRDFCEKYFCRVIDILDFQDQFFRELYRSCNVPVYKYVGLVSQEDIKNIKKVYGSEISKSLKKVRLPIRYTILNPANIIAGGNISFSDVDFYQRLTPYEIQRLKSPQTEEDEQFFESLPDEIKKEISKGGVNQEIDVPLDANYTYMIFNKKQDYEPMAVPMGWPVLSDLNWKAEMKAIDMAVARTTQRVVLLITMGYESKEGEYMVDPKILTATQELFDSESVGKVLVADFTTKAEFVIPDIKNILDPKKYTQVNEDIRTGLNNILVGSNEKFANQSIKVKLFIERLQQSRETFLKKFLIPEVKKICKEMGFRKYPEPHFHDLELKDEDVFNRLITRLTEIGVLTAEECFQAMETGRLPTGEESEESQSKYKKLRDKGLYEPLIGGGKNQQMEGRPAGSKAPQTTKKVKPSKAKFSAKLVTENMVNAAQVFKKAKDSACKKYKVKKLSPEQEEVVNLIAEQIIINEEPSNWMSSVSKYLNDPSLKNQAKYDDVIGISDEYQVTDFVAGILHASQNKLDA